MPEATLRAVADHGDVRGDTVRPGYHDAAEVLAALAEIGVDYDDVVDKLERRRPDHLPGVLGRAGRDRWSTNSRPPDAAPTATTRRRSMPDEPTFAIVGAGLAGAKAAEALREPRASPDASSCSGPRPHRPYERPPLSKGYLQGSAERDTVYVHPPEWYADHQIDLRLGTAGHRRRPPRPRVVTADGNRVRYDKLLLATGATPAPTAGARRRPRRRAVPALASTTATSSRPRSAPAPGS